jgi:predicted DNA-binding protein
MSPMWCMFVYMRKRTNIYLDAGHLQRLKVLSEKTGAPVSALIRKAIDAYLKNIK